MDSSLQEGQGRNSSLGEEQGRTVKEEQSMSVEEDEGMSVEVTCFQTFEEAGYIQQCNYYIEVGIRQLQTVFTLKQSIREDTKTKSCIQETTQALKVCR